MTTRRFAGYVLSVGLFVAQSVWPQASLVPGSATPPAQSEVPQDPLGRTTPRGTVRGFLSAEGKGDNQTAIQYLNTRLRGEAAALLAQQLFVVLNKRLPARLNEISDQPQGSLSYPAEPDKDLVGTISSDTGDVDILVQRVDRKNAASLWLFSHTTLQAIPELYEEVNSEASQSPVLKLLLETKIVHIALMQWLGLLIGLPLLYFLAARLNGSLSRLLGHVRRQRHKNPGLPNPEFLPVPVRLLMAAFIIRWTISVLGLPLLARQFWAGIAAITAIAGSVWLITRLNRWFESKIRLRLGRLNLTGALSILRFARAAVDGVIIFVGLLVLLHYFGINATTALAGLGVGGIAVALAAQKTLENVIAGISLISDKAISVGDFLKVGDTLGTVTDIGLRSTRIRTLSRTVVNVPNGQIASTSLENMSLRDQFWFHHILALTYQTSVSEMRSILQGATKLLIERDHVDASSVHVRLLRFGASSLDVEVFAYVFAGNWKHFLSLQEELLLEVMELVEAAGAHIALPSTTTYLATSAVNGWEAGSPGTHFTRPASTAAERAMGGS